MNAVVKHESRNIVPAAVTTPAQLLAMAVQQGADLDRLEKLMGLQERWDANEARKAYVAAMTAFKAEPVNIGKLKHVRFVTQKGVTEYDHAELSDVTDAIVPALSKHGLSHRWNVKQDGTTITVECVMTHELGHSESVSMTAPPDASGGKNSIQQIASTVTYLQRYTLLAITGQSTKGQDNDGRGSQVDPHEDEWLSAVEAVTTPEGLEALRHEIQDANLKGTTLRNVRAAFIARRKEMKA